MGFTHYWDTRNCTEEDEQAYSQALPIIKDIVNRHATLICFEYDRPERKPLATRSQIRFNGKGEEGHETLIFRLNGKWEFCKTARKPYDLAVCEVLLVLKAYLPNMSLSSDGFYGVLREQQETIQLEENWPRAMENVKRYGIHYSVQITRERDPFCDMGLVLQSVDRSVRRTAYATE